MPALYNNIQSKNPRPLELINESTFITLRQLRDEPEGVIFAQVMHAKKANRQQMTYKADRTKRIARSYDRMVILRDCGTGEPFYVLSETSYISSIVFLKAPRLGTYMALYHPEYTNNRIGTVPIVNYKDVLFPVERPENPNQTITNVIDGQDFGLFHTVVPAENFPIRSITVEKVCFGTICDGVLATCCCMTHRGIKTFAVGFKINVPVDGLQTGWVRYNGTKLTQKLFTEDLIRNLQDSDIRQVAAALRAKLETATHVHISGWVTSSVSDDDDMATVCETHLSVVDFIFPENFQKIAALGNPPNAGNPGNAGNPANAGNPGNAGNPANNAANPGNAGNPANNAANPANAGNQAP